MIISYGLFRATFSDIVFTHINQLEGYIFRGALH